MTDITSKGSPLVRGTTPSQGSSPSRSLNEKEKDVDQAVKKTLVPHNKDIETQGTEVTTKIRDSTPEEQEKFEPSTVSFQAVESVKEELQHKTVEPPRSIRDKWANASFENILLKLGEEPMGRVLTARKKVDEIKGRYRSLLASSPPTPMQNEVNFLLKTGTMEKVEGGTGGVYFLCDAEGKRKYVIKPGDEAGLAINNGKKRASPFFDEDYVCAPKGGIRIYEAVQNAELTDKAAELFNLQEITPKTEVMIIEHPVFHDILDGTEEKMSPAAQKLEEEMPTTREKVCLVQPYIGDCQDIGTYLASQARLEPSDLKRLLVSDFEAYQSLEEEHTPRDIDHSQYEALAILAFITGEKDGNAGNFLCSETVEEGSLRSVYKIDNAATFPDDNEDLSTGLCWIPHNYGLALSQKSIELIQNIDRGKIEQLKGLMQQRGKSEASIFALEARISFLKEWSLKTSTIEELDGAFDVI